MLSILVRRADWVTAGYLADHLGVTPRSVRSYVTAINSQEADAIESGPLGYRATPRAAAVGFDELEPDRGTPRERIHTLIRWLLDATEGVDVFEAALALHVSPGTIEADLRRIRGMLRGAGVVMEREAAVVWLEGSEIALRRFVARVVHEEIDESALDLAAVGRAAGKLRLRTDAFADTGRELVSALSRLGYAVNELAAADVVLRVAIAVDRASHGHVLERTGGPVGDERARVAEVIGEITLERFGVALGEGDLLYLASLVLLAIVDPGSAGANRTRLPDPKIQAAVERAVTRVVERHGTALDEEPLVSRLALHAENYMQRAEEQLFSRNPMTRSLKAASPLVFEMAVSLAADLARDLGTAFPDDEITDIAMLLGTALDSDRAGRVVLTATLVCPGLDEMRRQLRQNISRSLGHDVEVTSTSTSYDPDWSGFDTDLVLTTIDPPATVSGAERIVRIPPFFTDRDASRIADAAARLRRQRRLAVLRAEIQRWFVPHGFVRNVEASTPEGIIRTLGAALQDEGIIDAAYVESTLEREGLSSTAFTESLAMPHAMAMTASRTAIAIAINEHAID